MTDTYPTELTAIQKMPVKANLNENIPTLRKYDFFEVLKAIAYAVKTGIQWPMLSRSFPPYQSVYHHFRSWSARGWFVSFLDTPGVESSWSDLVYTGGKLYGNLN